MGIVFEHIHRAVQKASKQLTMVSKGQGKGGLELPAILKTIDIKKIQIGLIASCATMLIILIICFATYGWLSCDGGLKTSLSEYKTKGGSGKLSELLSNLMMKRT